MITKEEKMAEEKVRVSDEIDKKIDVLVKKLNKNERELEWTKKTKLLHFKLLFDFINQPIIKEYGGVRIECINGCNYLINDDTKRAYNLTKLFEFKRFKLSAWFRDISYSFFSIYKDYYESESIEHSTNDERIKLISERNRFGKLMRSNRELSLHYVNGFDFPNPIIKDGLELRKWYNEPGQREMLDRLFVCAFAYSVLRNYSWQVCVNSLLDDYTIHDSLGFIDHYPLVEFEIEFELGFYDVWLNYKKLTKEYSPLTASLMIQEQMEEYAYIEVIAMFEKSKNEKLAQ